MSAVGRLWDLKTALLMAQVNRRKKRAKKLELPETLCEFYENTRSYPHWQNKHGSIVPKSISKVYGERDSVGFTYRNNRYHLQLAHTASMPDGENLGRIELQINDTRVLEISVSNYRDALWHAGDVTAFLEGPWVKSFKALAAEAQRLRELQIKLGFQNEEALRARFDIAPWPGFYWFARIKNCFADFLKRT